MKKSLRTAWLAATTLTCFFAAGCLESPSDWQSLSPNQLPTPDAGLGKTPQTKRAAPAARPAAAPASTPAAEAAGAEPAGVPQATRVSPPAESGTGANAAAAKRADDGTRRPTDAASPPVAATPPPDDATVPTAVIEDQAPQEDLFGQLRDADYSHSAERNVRELESALRHLQTLEGAHFDEQTGQLILYGEVTEDEGPFHLEDLVVALRAEFHEVEPLGVTIDPNQAAPQGPVMDVKFFAGAENTNLGRVMFEADRLLKCLGLGKHNETQQPVTSAVEGYYPLPKLKMHFSAAAGASVWSRFWIVPTLDTYPEDDSRGKPIVTVADNGNTIWFEDVRLYVRTEIMHAQAGGAKLVSSGGQQDQASKHFADLVTVKFDEFAAEFPVLRELNELTKLLVLASWIRERSLPIDYELLYLRGEDAVQTPRQTPTLSVSFQAQSGNEIRMVTMFGGVELKSEPFYAQDSSGHARQMSAEVSRQAEAVQETVAHQFSDAQGQRKQFISFRQRGRAPPSSTTPAASTQRRRALRVRESSGSVRPTARDGSVALQSNLSVRPTDTPAQQTTLQGFDLPVFRDPVTGTQQLNLPVLRVGYNPRESKIQIVETGGAEFRQPVADYVYLTSPLRDINIRFANNPEFDQQRLEFFFPSESPLCTGFFPKTNTVEMRDGTKLQFAPDSGLLSAVAGGGKPNLEFAHPAYQDGTLEIREERSYAQLQRPPPANAPPQPQRRPVVVRRSRGQVDPTARTSEEIKLSLNEFSPARIEVRNRANDKRVQVREQAGHLVFVEADLE